MTKHQESANKKSLLRDSLLLIIFSLIVFLLSILYRNLFFKAIGLGLPELLIIILIAAFAFYSWRRWKEFKKEIGERRQAEQAIRYQAYHDALTGLPNRALFNDRLSVQLSEANRYQENLAVLFLDLDFFKKVNDNLGHIVGDELLKQVGNRLTKILRKSESVARIGGDEFLILLPKISYPENIKIVSKRILSCFKQPFIVDRNKIDITTSIGIAMYPIDGQDTETLIRNADIAMYFAKEKGRNQYQFHKDIGVKLLASRKPRVA